MIKNSESIIYIFNYFFKTFFKISKKFIKCILKNNNMFSKKNLKSSF